MMRVKALLLAAACLFFAAPAAAAPQRVMSLFLCSDQLVLDLLPPERITSVSYLARDGYGSYLAAAARRVGINYGNAEDVLKEHPDLVIAGSYTTTATRALLKKLRIPLLEIPPANNFSEIREVTRMVGRAVGAGAKAEELIAHMDATLAELAASKPEKRIVVAAWEGSGSVAGKGSLFEAILEAAGASNLAMNVEGNIDLETLLVARPDMLAFGSASISQPSLRNAEVGHPLVRKIYAGREIVYPELLYSCGLPETAEAAKELRAKIFSVPPIERRP